MVISAQRNLPIWKAKTFWSNKNAIAPYQFTSAELSHDDVNGHKGVLLLADTFNAYFEDENLQAALAVLKAAGYRVHIPQKSLAKEKLDSTLNTCSKEFCCGRTYLDAGMVDKTKASLDELVNHLSPSAEKIFLSLV